MATMRTTLQIVAVMTMVTMAMRMVTTMRITITMVAALKQLAACITRLQSIIWLLKQPSTEDCADGRCTQ